MLKMVMVMMIRDWLVLSNTSVLHLHYFKRLNSNLPEVLRCFNSSRGRVRKFLLYQLEKHLKLPLIIFVSLKNSGERAMAGIVLLLWC